MPYYCANYYGSINCHNTVTSFGDRCKLCLALKSGASLSDGMLPDEPLHMKGSRKEDNRGRTRIDGMGRPVRVDTRIKN